MLPIPDTWLTNVYEWNIRTLQHTLVQNMHKPRIAKVAYVMYDSCVWQCYPTHESDCNVLKYALERLAFCQLILTLTKPLRAPAGPSRCTLLGMPIRRKIIYCCVNNSPLPCLKMSCIQQRIRLLLQSICNSFSTRSRPLSEVRDKCLWLIHSAASRVTRNKPQSPPSKELCRYL